jgi:hypothetical protein
MDLAATSDNLLLLLIFFGLYLADCVVLLKPAQALAQPTLARRRRGTASATRGLGIGSRWRAALDFGLTVYPVRGRTLALLNPLTPCVTVFKTRPLDQDSAGAGSIPALTLRQMLAIRIRTARMSIALVSHGALLFVILPLLLLSGETTRLLIALAAAFLSAILILAVCYVDRRAARLSTSGFWAIAGQALLCLPVSLNAPRKLALLVPAALAAPEWLPAVPEEQRPAALGELRLTLDRAAGEDSDDVARVAEALRRKLVLDYPEA